MSGITNGSTTTPSDRLEPIAIIGFSLKYSGDAESPESFWQTLEERRCTMVEWPKDRANLEAYVSRDGNGSTKVAMNNFPIPQLIILTIF